MSGPQSDIVVQPRPAAPRVGVWAAAAFVLFFTRGLLFSTWVSRGPEVQRLLGLDAMQFGLLTMLVPLGGLLAISRAGSLVGRFGSPRVAAAGYTVGSVALALAGFTISGRAVVVTCVLLLLVGGPLAIVDFVGNLEGALVDKVAKRSVLATIHGAFGLGMLSAASLTGLVSNAGMRLGMHFLLVGVVVLVASLIACLGLPRKDPSGRPASQVDTTSAADADAPRRSVWSEPRSRLVALIGFAFIMAETSAGTWVPINLTSRGSSQAHAAYALSLFWLVVTVGRLAGGLVVDAVGRRMTVLGSALVTSVGVVLFMIGGGLGMVGVVLWAGGMALGFPMSVSTMSDDPTRASARVNMIITVVYLSNICVGPALGAVAQGFGLQAAFVVPLVFLVAAAAVSRVTRPDPPEHVA